MHVGSLVSSHLSKHAGRWTGYSKPPRWELVYALSHVMDCHHIHGAEIDSGSTVFPEQNEVVNEILYLDPIQRLGSLHPPHRSLNSSKTKGEYNYTPIIASMPWTCVLFFLIPCTWSNSSCKDSYQTLHDLIKQLRQIEWAQINDTGPDLVFNLYLYLYYQK